MSRAGRAAWPLLCVVVAGACSSPSLTVPPPPELPPAPLVAISEDFEDRDYSEFTVTDPATAGSGFARRESYVSRSSGLGFALERRLSSTTDGRFVETLQTTSRRAVPGLSETAIVELRSRFEIVTPDGGEARFGLGVGAADTFQPGYFAFVTLGDTRSVLGLTRNDGVADLFEIFGPIAGELELELRVERATGLVEAAVGRPGFVTGIAALGFSDFSPLGPDSLYFLTALNTSADSAFIIDDLELTELR